MVAWTVARLAVVMAVHWVGRSAVTRVDQRADLSVCWKAVQRAVKTVGCSE